MSTIPSLVQASAVDLDALASNPNVLVLIVNLDGTGMTRERLLDALNRLISTQSQPSPHQIRPDAYRRFLTVRYTKDDAASRALYDVLAAMTQERCLNPLVSKLLWIPILGIGNAADLAATTRQQLLSRDWQEEWYSTSSFRLSQQYVDEIDGWLMAKFGIRLIDEKAEPAEPPIVNVDLIAESQM